MRALTRPPNSAVLQNPTGLGLRAPHYSYILDNKPDIGWFEAISENYMGFQELTEGRPLEILRKVRALYPIVLHGVSLSIGSTDELNFDYLRSLKRLIEEIEPAWVSDHFCWTGVNGENLHDLMPLPYTQETVSHLVERIDQVQNFLKRQFVFENVSAYLSFSHSEMTEWQFLSEVSQKSGCGLLLDVNNVYVSSINQNFNAAEFIHGIPADKIQQIHLAGHLMTGHGLIDTHDRPVIDEVWNLYRQTLNHIGAKPTLIEWDDQIPEFPVLEAEAQKAQLILQSQTRTDHDSPITA
jgi:uncharacterized protein